MIALSGSLAKGMEQDEGEASFPFFFPSFFDGKDLDMFLVLEEGVYGERKVEQEVKQGQSLGRNRRWLRARALVGIYIWRQEKIGKRGVVERFCLLYLLIPIFELSSDFAGCGICCLEFCVSPPCVLCDFFLLSFLTVSCSFSLENCRDSLSPQLRFCSPREGIL